MTLISYALHTHRDEHSSRYHIEASQHRQLPMPAKRDPNKDGRAVPDQNNSEPSIVTIEASTEETEVTSKRDDKLTGMAYTLLIPPGRPCTESDVRTVNEQLEITMDPGRSGNCIEVDEKDSAQGRRRESSIQTR